jgi:transglutaminase-like putative cysteine protease
VIVNDPRELPRLITPDDKRVKALAAELKTPENAYRFVQERIINDAADPALPAGEIIARGKASCLGKAILLCSLYRAMGMPASDVRVIAGEIEIPDRITDHAWLEMEYKGRCIQQDVSNVLGTFAFDQFHESTYVEVFIRDEEFVFNDKQFALVSQLNRMKGTGHPPM